MYVDKEIMLTLSDKEVTIFNDCRDAIDDIVTEMKNNHLTIISGLYASYDESDLNEFAETLENLLSLRSAE